MKYIFVFEDNENTPSSKLLRENIAGVRFCFSNGAYLVAQLVEDLCNEEGSSDYEILVFIDYVPMNYYTYDTYMTLLDIKEEFYWKKNTKIYVLPIVCIEYYILKMLSSFYEFDIPERFSDLYDSLIIDLSFDHAVLKEFTSLEKAYKFLLQHSKKRCMINKNSENEVKIEGYFYKYDCVDCRRRLCVNKKNLVVLKEKAMHMYTSLPVFKIVSEEQKKYMEELGISFEYNSVEEVVEELRRFIRSIFRKFGISATEEML